MFYTVYKITNTLNGKFYIGVHQTRDLNDDYMGSGKIIQRAIGKYGIENFKKEYLHIVESSEEMYKMEAEIVNEDFVRREDTYNLKVGGFGGFDYINKQVLNNSAGQYKSAVFQSMMDAKNNPKKYEKVYKRAGIRLKKLHEEGKIPYVKSFLGKTHSEETKKKIGEASSKRESGKGNSQYGTMWIHSEEQGLTLKIKKKSLMNIKVKDIKKEN